MGEWSGGKEDIPRETREATRKYSTKKKPKMLENEQEQDDVKFNTLQK